MILFMKEENKYPSAGYPSVYTQGIDWKGPAWPLQLPVLPFWRGPGATEMSKGPQYSE
jgi:hypothetical protein